MMDIFNKVVNEKGNDLIQDRFSSMSIIFVLVYGLFYYVITPEKMQKPHILLILVLLCLHIFQFLGIKYFHSQKKFRYSLLLIIVPMLLYGIYVKYAERQAYLEKERYLKFKYLMELEKKLNGPDDLISKAPQTEYIIRDNKLPQENNVMIPQISPQQSPPMALGYASNGAAPNQQYEYGQQYPQYNGSQETPEMARMNQMAMNQRSNMFGSHLDTYEMSGDYSTF